MQICLCGAILTFLQNFQQCDYFQSQRFMLQSDCSSCCLSMADHVTINVHVFVLVSCS